MFRRSWVRIPAPYTGWTFFTFICCRKCIVEKTKLNEKEAGDVYSSQKINFAVMVPEAFVTVPVSFYLQLLPLFAVSLLCAPFPLRFVCLHVSVVCLFSRLLSKVNGCDKTSDQQFLMTDRQALTSFQKKKNKFRRSLKN